VGLIKSQHVDQLHQGSQDWVFPNPQPMGWIYVELFESKKRQPIIDNSNCLANANILIDLNASSIILKEFI